MLLWWSCALRPPARARRGARVRPAAGPRSRNRILFPVLAEQLRSLHLACKSKMGAVRSSWGARSAVTLFLASGVVLCVDGLTLLELKTSIAAAPGGSGPASAGQRVRGDPPDSLPMPSRRCPPARAPHAAQRAVADGAQARTLAAPPDARAVPHLHARQQVPPDTASPSCPRPRGQRAARPTPPAEPLLPLSSQACAARAIRSRPPLMVAVQPGTGTMSAEEPLDGPTFHKSISAPDPIPKAGRRRAMELMESGALFRYSPGFISETSLAEADIADYTGFKYAVGFNSCGSALFIGLKVRR